MFINCPNFRGNLTNPIFIGYTNDLLLSHFINRIDEKTIDDYRMRKGKIIDNIIRKKPNENNFRLTPNCFNNLAVSSSKCTG